VSVETVNCFKTRLDRFFGLTKVLYIDLIIVLKFTEPEAEVNLQLNLHQSIHDNCVIESGKEAIA